MLCVFERLDSDWCFKHTHTLLTHSHWHIRRHTWSAAREQEIFKSFKGCHLAAASLLSFTYPTILSSPAVVPSFCFTAAWFSLCFVSFFTIFCSFRPLKCNWAWAYIPLTSATSLRGSYSTKDTCPAGAAFQPQKKAVQQQKNIQT